MNHIITAGCSFTQRQESWANIGKSTLKKYKFHNVGMSGVGNYVISTLCINKVSQLISDGVDPANIFVIVQWSGIFRKSFISSRSLPTGHVNLHECPDPVYLHPAYTKDTNQWHADKVLINVEVEKDKSKLCWDVGRDNVTSEYWRRYYGDYWSDECAFIETLENILRVQWFLKSQNINFLMFTGWDIFTVGDDLASEQHGKRRDILSFLRGKSTSKLTNDQWSKTRYTNITNSLTRDDHKWSHHLWDMVDFDRFLFFSNHSIKYGGMLQWVQWNIDNPDSWYFKEGDTHPSPQGHQEFFKSCIEPVILSNFGDKNE